MFSSINNIFGTKPHHAEQNDTRQDIQRHDPDFERRRKKKNEAKDELLQEDGATVSVDALIIFLNKFLKELSEKQPKKGFNATSGTSPKPDNTAETTPSNTSAHKSGKAAQAASAYQHMAESQHQNTLLGDVNENNADLISLDAAEIRTIHTLLEDLKLLDEKNIEFIHIDRAESFLQSLVNAVEKVKLSQSFSA